MEEEKDDKSCCTWPKVIIALVLLGVVGVVIWQFAPVDEALDKVIPIFNGTNAPTAASKEEVAPTASPTANPFNRCAPDSQCCINGVDNICDLGVNDIMYSMLHNAMATLDGGFLAGPNHVAPLEGALEKGFRGINVDVCNCGGTLQLCHGVCNYGAREVDETFTNINQFLDDNPNEVLMITLQITSDASLGGQVVDINDFYAVLQGIDGLTDKLYVHPSITTDWPLLKDVVATNKRILFFHFNGPNCRDTPCPAGLHYWFEYAAETEFDFKNVAAFDNTAESCTVTRGGNLAREPASRTFFAINSFVSPPTANAAQTLNDPAFAKTRIDDCRREYNNLDVNVVSLDFWATGDMVQFQQDVNVARGLTATRRRELHLRHTSN